MYHNKIQLPKPIFTTVEGLRKLQDEQKALQDERPLAVADLKKAREMGDLSENGYYKSARFKLSSIDARLRSLTHILRYAKVREIYAKDIVDIGITVVLKSQEGEITYTIVGEHEANPQEKKISHLSPLGKAVMGKKVGDVVTIMTPSGQKTHTITAVTIK